MERPTHRFIRSFKEGERIDGVYLVKERSFNKTRKGSSYIFLQLSDRTGMIKGNKWVADKRLFDSFGVDGFIRIKGFVESYNGFLQLNIDSIEKKEEKDTDISLFVPVSERDCNVMFDSLLSEIGKITDPYLRRLLDNIFSDKAIADSFKRSPAATDFHHAYLGGLLEHTLSSLDLAKTLISKYPGIKAELLMSAVILHDIGKIEELSCRRSFYYTDKGRLVGHIVLGVNLVEKKISNIPGFPEDLRDLLLHIILSHHGEHEWGSPKRPMCLEAVIMHHIDNLDAKINGFNCFAANYADDDSNWTSYSRMFREFLYTKSMPLYVRPEPLDNDKGI